MEQLSPQLMNRLVFAVIMHGLNDAQTNLALTVLTDALKHPNSQIRELAVVALGDLSVPPAKRVPPLVYALKDDSPKVRRRAARAIGEQGPTSHTALPQLIVGLKDVDASVRRDCAGAIGRLGGAAASAAGPLVGLLRESEYRSRAVAAVALKRIGTPAISALLAGVRCTEPELRGRCATLLAKIAPYDEAVQSVILEARSDVDGEVRARADEALQLVNTPMPMLAVA